MAQVTNVVEVAGDRFIGNHIPGGVLAELIIPARRGYGIVVNYIQVTADHADSTFKVFNRVKGGSKFVPTAAAAAAQKDIAFDVVTGLAAADYLYLQTDDGYVFGSTIASIAALVVTLDDNIPANYDLEATKDFSYERDKTAAIYSEGIGAVTKTLNNASGVLVAAANDFLWIEVLTTLGAAVTIDLCVGEYVPMSRV